MEEVVLLVLSSDQGYLKEVAIRPLHLRGVNPGDPATRTDRLLDRHSGANTAWSKLIDY